MAYQPLSPIGNIIFIYITSSAKLYYYYIHAYIYIWPLFLDFASLITDKWYLFEALICIFFYQWVEHILPGYHSNLYLLLSEMLVQFICTFFISLITFFLLIHKSSLPILLMNPSLEHKLKYYGIIHFSLRGVSLNRFFFNFSILKSIKLFLYVPYFLRHVLKFLPYSRQ